MLEVFLTHIYALLDPSATLSFVTPLVAMIFIYSPKLEWSVLQCPPQLVTRLFNKESIEIDMFLYFIKSLELIW